MGRRVVPDLDGLTRELLLQEVEGRAAAPDRHRCHDRAAGIERRHRSLEALVPRRARLLLANLGAAEQVRLRHPAVVEPQRRRVGGADSELLLEAHELQSGRSGRDDERLDAAAAGLLVDRRPDDHEASLDLRGALAGGAEDLRAVQHPLLTFFVEVGRRLDGGSVGARFRLRDRHRSPDRVLALAEGPQEPGALLRSSRGADRRAAESGGRHPQVETRVAEAELFGLDAHGDEAVALGSGIAWRSLTSVFPPVVDPFARQLVLLPIGLPGCGSHSLERNPVEVLPRKAAVFGELERNRHLWTSDLAGIFAARRPNRFGIQTRVSASKLASPAAFRRCSSGRYSRM